MTKMDMIWIAAASLLYPSTSSKRTITRKAIQGRVTELFGVSITPVVVERHLVSSVDRQADKGQPSRGGSRNRYLYRTHDGITPSLSGNFRLYKTADTPHDAHEKTGKTLPEVEMVAAEYQHFLHWYTAQYLNAPH